MIRGVHHIGIAVPDLQAAIGFYERALGLSAEILESPPGSVLRFAMIRLPGAGVELLAPNADTTPISNFLARRGQGVHHIAFEVDNIRSAMAAGVSGGLQPLTEEPLLGVEGTLTCFFHPRDTLGVLLEYVQPLDSAQVMIGKPTP